VGVRGCIEKNSSPTSTRDKAKIENISEGPTLPMKKPRLVISDNKSEKP